MQKPMMDEEEVMSAEAPGRMGLAMTVTVHPDGQVSVTPPAQVEVGDASPADEEEAGMEMGAMGKEAESEGGEQIFPTMDKAVKYLVTMASEMSGSDEEESMMGSYGPGEDM